jgi:nickel superoxide dismutase
MQKYQDNDDPMYSDSRSILIKEQRAELAEARHLWVLWTDYFKPEHLEKHPEPPRPVLARYQASRHDQAFG